MTEAEADLNYGPTTYKADKFVVRIKGTRLVVHTILNGVEQLPRVYLWGQNLLQVDVLLAYPLDSGRVLDENPAPIQIDRK